MTTHRGRAQPFLSSYTHHTMLKSDAANGGLVHHWMAAETMHDHEDFAGFSNAPKLKAFRYQLHLQELRIWDRCKYVNLSGA
jgi:hypothetical protein